jgi:hypothetical protein
MLSMPWLTVSRAKPETVTAISSDRRVSATS